MQCTASSSSGCWDGQVGNELQKDVTQKFFVEVDLSIYKIRATTLMLYVSKSESPNVLNTYKN